MRQLRGMEIIARGGQVRCVADSHYLVRSQNGSGWRGWYNVQQRNGRWVCECPDYLKREKTCKHAFAVAFLLSLPEILLVNVEFLFGQKLSNRHHPASSMALGGDGLKR